MTDQGASRLAKTSMPSEATKPPTSPGVPTASDLLPETDSLHAKSTRCLGIDHRARRHSHPPTAFALHLLHLLRGGSNGNEG